MKRRLRKQVRKLYWYLDGDLSGDLPDWVVRLFWRVTRGPRGVTRPR